MSLLTDTVVLCSRCRSDIGKLSPKSLAKPQHKPTPEYLTKEVLKCLQKGEESEACKYFKQAHDLAHGEGTYWYAKSLLRNDPENNLKDVISLFESLET